MAKVVEARLRELGIELPDAPAPAASYVPTIRSGSLLYVSGQVPMENGSVRYLGKAGVDVSLDDAVAAARLCAINIIAQVRQALVDLDRVIRVIKLTGFVNSTPDFTDQPKVINGASDLMVDVFEDKGPHARSAIGVASLPLGATVEGEAILEVA